jgi:hypothetical protein
MTLNGGLLEVAAFGSSTWTSDLVMATAGVAVFRQFTVDSPTYVASTYMQSGTGGTAVSIEIAIYNEQRQRLCTTGTFTNVGLTYVQTAFTAPVTLQAGCYYVCYHNKNYAVSSGVTVAFRGTSAMTVSKHRAMGTFEQNVGSGALPATATFATFATNTTQGAPYLSLFGL